MVASSMTTPCSLLVSLRCQARREGWRWCALSRRCRGWWGASRSALFHSLHTRATHPALQIYRWWAADMGIDVSLGV